MKFTLDDNIILDINDYISEFNLKFIFCGSISLYLNGITEITEFSDVDIDFCDCTQEEKLLINIGLIFKKYPIDKLSPVENIPLKYHEIDFYNRKLLISDLDYELNVREYFIKEYKDYIYKDKALMRIEQIKKYLNN